MIIFPFFFFLGWKVCLEKVRSRPHSFLLLLWLHSYSSEGKILFHVTKSSLNLNMLLYLLSKILGGWLSMRFGPRWVIFYSMLLPSGLTLITPVIANLDLPPLLIVLRLLMGLLHVWLKNQDYFKKSIILVEWYNDSRVVCFQRSLLYSRIGLRPKKKLE